MCLQCVEHAGRLLSQKVCQSSADVAFFLHARPYLRELIGNQTMPKKAG